MEENYPYVMENGMFRDFLRQFNYDRGCDNCDAKFKKDSYKEAAYSCNWNVCPTLTCLSCIMKEGYYKFEGQDVYFYCREHNKLKDY